MGRTKDEFMDVRVKCEMSEETYLQIPEHLRDEMEFKMAKAANLKDLYKADKHWVAANIDVSDCMKKRAEHEARIRIENKKQ